MQEFLELATPADAEAVLALYRRQIGRPGCAWNEHYPDASFVRVDLQRRALRVVREGERLLAAVSLLEQDDDELEALGCWTVSPACEAVRLCVAPDAQGRGIGGRVMRALLDEAAARGFAAMRLLCSTGNAAARRLYKREGFARRGQCRLYGEDFLCLEKNLPLSN